MLSNILVRPLKEVTWAAEQIAEGNYDIRLTAKSNDKLGRLAHEIMLMKRAISMLLTQAADKKIELIQETPEDLPQVKADPNKIARVLTNLIANSLRYTGEGGHIWVSAKHMNDFAGSGDGQPAYPAERRDELCLNEVF